MHAKTIGAVATLSALILAGCGGGGGGGNPSPGAAPGASAPGSITTPSTPTTPNPTTPNPTTPASNDACSAHAITYQLSDGYTLVPKVNEMGALGYAFVTDIVPAGKPYGVFVNNESGKYTYRVAAPFQDVASWKAALNANGQEGYLFKSPSFITDQPSDLYVKNTACNHTYAYEVETAADTKAAALEQMNAWGQKGYNTLQPFFLGGNIINSLALYFKDSASTDTFSHDLVASPLSATEAQMLLSQRGAQGWSYLGPRMFKGVSYAWFIKRSTVSTIEYQVVDTALPTSVTASGIQDVFNQHAKQGFYYFSSEKFGNSSVDIYYKSAKMVQQPFSGFSNP